MASPSLVLLPQGKFISIIAPTTFLINTLIDVFVRRPTISEWYVTFYKERLFQWGTSPVEWVIYKVCCSRHWVVPFYHRNMRNWQSLSNQLTNSHQKYISESATCGGGWQTESRSGPKNRVRVLEHAENLTHRKTTPKQNKPMVGAVRVLRTPKNLNSDFFWNFPKKSKIIFLKKSPNKRTFFIF